MQREEKHDWAQTPAPQPPPHPFENWQAHFNPVSEKGLLTDWQEILALDQDQPFEYYHIERELQLPTKAHVTSAEDTLLTKWTGSGPLIWLSAIKSL